MKKAFFFTARIGVAISALASVFLFACADGLVEMFIANTATVAYGIRFLRGFCLALPLLCVDFLAVGTFQAVGMGRESLFFAIARKLALELPLLYLLNAVFPLYGIPYAQPAAEAVLAVTACVVLSRFFRRAEREAGGVAERIKG